VDYRWPKRCPFLTSQAGNRARWASLFCGRKFCTSARKLFRFATWNVRTLLDNEDTDRPARRTAPISAELCRYDVDTAALSEARLTDEGSLSEAGGGYTLFWKGLPHDARRIHGVGFGIRSSLLAQITESPVGINERPMTLRLPLIKGSFMTAISAYAPTLVPDETTKDSFYSCLRATLQAVPRNDRLVILGNFNARVGTNHNVWSGVIGKNTALGMPIATASVC